MQLKPILEHFAHQNAELADAKKLEQEAPAIPTASRCNSAEPHAVHSPANPDFMYLQQLFSLV